ncbi:hypothetical protein MX572_26065 (plasmid) [Rhodococcus pyridinivorans]|uniref:hypothetical protein n=1 Tax=Rhodococcus pyridinivorans TaxID=103816 RepID=UPI0020C5D50F|nr:hypothetical protein [Rhodococcus pyridinivorans]UTM40116.1 hypothetical protein MX572_26065 [Rhodococcus pyridinivorans]
MSARKTPAELADMIRQNLDLELDAIREFLSAAVTVTDVDTLRPGPAPRLIAPSVALDDVTVTVWLTASDPAYLGTFDRTTGTRMIRVSIQARSNNAPGTGHPERSGPAVRLPAEEQIAWVQVVLGDLSDYAYRVVNEWGRYRIRPEFFVVFIDRGGIPRLAPSDFQWVLISGGRRAYPEKLIPDDPELLAYLRNHGDLIPADRVPHPQGTSPQVWAHQFVSHLTATLADELGRIGNGRRFTFDEINLHGHSKVIVRYTWHLAAGDKAYGFDIDLAGVRAQRLRLFDDPRARTAATSIGMLPFDQPVFRAPEVIDGVTWVRFGTPE